MKFADAGVVGSREELATTLEDSQNWDTVWVRYIPSEDEITVRFLTEPDEWFRYREHWGDSVRSYYACIGEDEGCPGCNADPSDEKARRVSKRFLTNALDVESGRVIPLKLPLDVVNRLQTRWERYDTLTDRDYILSRTGSGLNTIYDVETGDKDALDVKQYKDQLHDLQQVLEDQWKDAWEKGDDKKPKKTKKASPSIDAEVDDEDMEEEVLTEDQIRKMKVAELEEVAEQLGLVIDPDWKKADYIEAILKEAE